MHKTPSLLLVSVLVASVVAADPASTLPDGTAAAQKAIAAFRLPGGMQAELFAAEPQLANPVAICLDERNRVFVAEEFRFNWGTEENRTRPFLLEDDLQIRTVDDRLALYKKWAKKFDGGMDWFTRHADQVRLLEDRDGDGRADRSVIFAGGFNEPLDGLGAGLITRDGDVWFTCIPHLWKLRDTKGVGKADVREPLLRGFGVNCAFLGHDLHGLVWGPEGKLYFSVGDRGFHVPTKEGSVISAPRTGAVFRCNPDGTELEVIHRGLRNPQELAFDQFGNLFADDNNCDKGDHSRLVYIVEDGDSGWNMSYQTLPAPYLTGPWHAERMWHLAHKGQPAWLVPPVGKLGAGPSGFTFTSGLSLPERYRNRFLYANYTGNGGIEAFGVVPRGAGFDMVDHHDFVKPLMATDVEVGYDGKVYISEFQKLIWDGGTAGGRIYTVFDPKRLNDSVVKETKSLFHAGFAKLSNDRLGRLLRHLDLRVRQRAQFTLAERNDATSFSLALASSEPQSTRLHAIWGLGQIARKKPEALQSVVPLLKDSDPEIRTQAARVIGDARHGGCEAALVQLLDDTSARVRFQAALALGKLRRRPAVQPLVELLRTNNDADPFLRHAAVTALARIKDEVAIRALVKDRSPAVRMGALLVLRRWHDSRIVALLNDVDSDLVTEAARAINDLPLDACNEALAQLLVRYRAGTIADPEPLLRRALNANFRLGKTEHARRVADIVANAEYSLAIRSEALAALRDWTAPPPRDRVTGFWRPLAKRDPAIVREALESRLNEILTRTTGRLQIDAVALIANLNLRIDAQRFVDWANQSDAEPAFRTAALQLLAARKHPRTIELAKQFLNDNSATLRANARDALLDLEPQAAMASLDSALEQPGGDLIEKQRALASLAKAPKASTSEILDRWSTRLAAGQVPAQLQLDVIELLRSVPTEMRLKAIQAFESRTRKPGDVLAPYRVSLYGGDAARGRDLFLNHSAGQCLRCHAINGKGGASGPDLAQVATRNPKDTREYLLESLIAPNAKIAPGFGGVTLDLANGKQLGGTLVSEDAKSIVIRDSLGKLATVNKKDVDQRSATVSPMPSMERAFSLRELRDLVEYLATLM